MNIRQANFIRERNEALFSLDRSRIEEYLRKRGKRIPENDIVFWASIYKVICHIDEAPAELVEHAKLWLYSHGMSEKIGMAGFQ